MLLAACTERGKVELSDISHHGAGDVESEKSPD